MQLNPWTAEMVGRATTLYKSGVSGSESANILSAEFRRTITRNAVIGKWHRMGFMGDRERAPKQKRPDAAPRRILRLRPTAGGNLHLIETVEKDPHALRSAEAVPLHVGLMDLEANSCRYPYGDSNFTFCGQKTTGDCSYCAAHKKLCWEKPMSDQKRRAARELAGRAHAFKLRAEVVAV